jgi:hypothetical protein
VAHERGETLDLACFINDRRRSRPTPDDAPATRAELDAAVGHGQLRVEYQRERPHERVFLDFGDCADALDYTLSVDTHAVTPEQQEWLLREIEHVLVTAAFDGDVPTGVAPEPVPSLDN